MKLKILLAALFFIVLACKQKNKIAPVDVTSSADTTSSGFLPVADFIKNDISRVDSFAGGILLKGHSKGKKDSAYITPARFHQLAAQFLFNELDSASFRQHFHESSLLDETTQLLNFIYMPRQVDWPLQKVIVYITNGQLSNQVNRIYMEKQHMQGDTLIQQKLTWKTGQYFYVVTIRQPKQGEAVTSIEKVIWDPQHFSEE